MKKILICLIIVISVVTLVMAEQKAVLPELSRPESVIADGDQLFVMDGVHIFIYSLRDFKLQAKIGKAGEGPQEFRKSPAAHLSSLVVHVGADQILVNSMGKVTKLTRTGDYKNESKVNFPFARYTPVGNKYGGIGIAREGKTQFLTISLFDGTFKKEKEIFRFATPAQRGKKRDAIKMASMNKNFIFYGSNDKLFIPTPDGALQAFDETGKKLYVIPGNLPLVKNVGQRLQELEKLFTTDFRFKRHYERDKANGLIYIGETMPLLKSYRVTDKKLYVISNKQEDYKFETFVYDTSNGKLLQKIKLPLAHLNILEEHPFDIYNEKVFQVVENEEEEEWELHITRIK